MSLSVQPGSARDGASERGDGADSTDSTERSFEDFKEHLKADPTPGVQPGNGPALSRLLEKMVSWSELMSAVEGEADGASSAAGTLVIPGEHRRPVLSLATLDSVIAFESERP